MSWNTKEKDYQFKLLRDAHTALHLTNVHYVVFK